MAIDYADLLYEHYIGDGVTTDFEYTAEYIDETDIKATVDAVEVPLTVVDATHFRITPAPVTGAAIILFRDSDITQAKFSFPDRTNIRTENLDGDFEQAIFLNQETRGFVQDRLENGGYFLGENIILAPAGNIEATNVQGGIYELDNEKAALNGDAGVNFSVNNLTVTGTVDGRDVSNDGSVVDTVVLNNDTAIVNPNNTNDSSEGYAVRSIWTNVTSETVFVCVDASEGAAIWLQLASGTSAGVDSVSGTAPISVTGAASNPVVELNSAWTGAYTFAGTMTFNGSLVSNNSAVFNANVNLAGGFQLAGATVNSSATEINYLSSVTPGTAAANKAVVIDTSSNISGLNNVNMNAVVDGNANPVVNYTADVDTVNGLTINGASLGNAPTINQTGTEDVGLTVEGVHIQNGAVTLGTGDAISDFQEGTFTPHLVDGTLNTSEGQSYFVRRGHYTKLGRRVFISLEINITSTGSLTGGQGASIGPLPFTSSSSLAPGALVAGTGTTLGSIPLGADVNGHVALSSDWITLTVWDSVLGISQLTVSELGAGAITLTGSYLTDD